MKSLSLLLVPILGLTIGVGTGSQIQGQEGGKKEGGILKLESKREKDNTLAPDFANAFDLPFASVETLGTRLMAARKTMNPIALAMVAVEIGVNEKVSGKKAEVTAETVHKEAVELATMRFVSSELKALALLTKDTVISKELATLSQKAAKAEAEHTADFKSGIKERGIVYLRVSNHANHHVDVYENGRYLGRVHGHSHHVFHTPHLRHDHAVHLRAHDHRGNHWRAHTIHGNHHEYHWTLNP